MGNLKFTPTDETLHKAREGRKDDVISYGVPYLDHATGGIRATDFVVIGGRTGAGKTELSSIIAQNCAKQGKKVFVFSLESEPAEFTNRILFRLLAKMFYEQERSKAREIFTYDKKNIYYRDFIKGKYEVEHKELIQSAEHEIETTMSDMQVLERDQSGFDLADFQLCMSTIEKLADVVIIDHIHHFDTNTDNEVTALKDTIKRIRDACLIYQKPIIAIAHFRKSDRRSQQLVPDLEEFHGSSEVSKEATQVITLAPYVEETPDTHLYPTLFKVCKLRIDNSVSRYVGKCYFNTSTNSYERLFTLHTLEKGGQELLALDELKYPHWGKQ